MPILNEISLVKSNAQDRLKDRIHENLESIYEPFDGVLSDAYVQLLKELDLAQNILWELFNLTQLNVAAIGNKTPQLHIHVIGRKLGDPAWPNTVWDHSQRLPYTLEQKEAMIDLLQSAFRE